MQRKTTWSPSTTSLVGKGRWLENIQLSHSKITVFSEKAMLKWKEQSAKDVKFWNVASLFRKFFVASIPASAKGICTTNDFTGDAFEAGQTCAADEVFSAVEGDLKKALAARWAPFQL